MLLTSLVGAALLGPWTVGAPKVDLTQSPPSSAQTPEENAAETPAEQAPAAEASAAEAPAAEDAPVEDAPAEDASAEDAPAEDTPAEAPPLESSSAEAAPAVDASAEASAADVQVGTGTPPAAEAIDPAGDTTAPELIEVQRPTPRLFETLYQFRDDEVATHQNAAGTVTFIPGLQVRNQIGYVSPFVLDRFGNAYQESAEATGRIRWNPTLRLGKKQNIDIVGQIDLVNGRWTPAGSDDPIIDEIISPPSDTVALGQPPGRQSLRYVDPRHLYMQWTSKVGQLRIGQMGFTWGQGMLANDGNNVDRYGDMKFGDDGPGDIFERVLFATRPFSPLGGIGRDFIIALGADVVFRDERLDLVESKGKDLGVQGIFVFRWQPENQDENYLGAYAVYRWQREGDDGDVYDDDTDLRVGVGDIAGQGVKYLRPNLQLLGGFEAVVIGGKTTIAWTEAYPEHKVLQGGIAGRAYIGDHDLWLAGLDFGFASGDANPADGRITNFTFDAGHTVGLVLFQAVNGWRSARSEILATNGELTGVPLNGTQFIPTRGAVTNAVYFHPKARYSLQEHFEVWGGPLFAFAPVDIADPYTTRLNGGTGTNSVGGDGSNRFYGSEIDLGFRGRYEWKKAWFQAGLQVGLLLPGLGIADAEEKLGAPVMAAQLRTEIRY